MEQRRSYAVRIGPFGPGSSHVLSIDGREQISHRFRYQITLLSAVPPALFERATLGRPAALAMRVGAERRTIHGVVTAVRLVGGRVAYGRDAHEYLVRLEPRVALLSLRAGSRIFRDQRADQVIETILAGVGATSAFRLERRLPSCDYLTQLEETDWSVVRRLAAENGLLFYFEPPPAEPLLERALDEVAELEAPLDLAALAGLLDEAPPAPGEVMVFTDRASYPSIARYGGAPTLRYRDRGELGGGEQIERFTLTRRIRPTAARYRDYDPARPTAPIEARLSMRDDPDGEVDPRTDEAVSTRNLGEAAAEILADAFDRCVEPASLELYEHGGRHLFPDWDKSHDEPGRILREARRSARLADGGGRSARLAAGHVFGLEDHLDLSGEYVVVSVRHRGRQDFHGVEGETAHRAELRCAPANVPFLPKRPPKRSVQSCFTATVVGPEGHDVFTNAQGEIKVRFHWDRRVGDPEAASAWIRALQPWAGPGWGTQFIPRVGMEVVVVFEGGDPDRPLVLGSLYNGVTPTPFRLPHDKTRSGIRTRSSPQGEGYNELSFQDAKGAEQVYLRAERNLDAWVRADRSGLIGGHDRLDVRGDRSTTIGRRSTLRVGDARVTVIGADEQLEVHGRRVTRVAGASEEQVGGNLTQRVGGSEHKAVAGSLALSAGGDLTANVAGSLSAIVGTGAAGPGSLALHVEGTAALTGREVVEIASDRELLLRCGSSFIRVAPGEIEISASKISVAAEDARLALAEGEAKLKVESLAQVVSDDAVVLRSSGASVALGGQAKIDGSQVLLNSPEQASDSIETSSLEPIHLELIDDDGAPIPHQRFRIELQGGGAVTGYLDHEGKAALVIPEGGQLTFPDLRGVEQA